MTSNIQTSCALNDAYYVSDEVPFSPARRREKLEEFLKLFFGSCLRIDKETKSAPLPARLTDWKKAIVRENQVLVNKVKKLEDSLTILQNSFEQALVDSNALTKQLNDLTQVLNIPSVKKAAQEALKNK